AEKRGRQAVHAYRVYRAHPGQPEGQERQHRGALYHRCRAAARLRGSGPGARLRRAEHGPGARCPLHRPARAEARENLV
nr:hypothetical protein [Tanacetum cinerariifolium]